MPLGFGDGRHSFHFKTCLLAIDERGEGGSDCSTRGGRHALPFQKGSHGTGDERGEAGSGSSTRASRP